MPALVYALIAHFIPGAITAFQEIVAGAYMLTAGMTLLEARASLGGHDEPEIADIDDPYELAELPTLSVVVSAYLPNEKPIVVETIVSLATELRVAPGRLQIILAYNTPEDIPDLEGMLASLAELNVAFLPLRVPGSRSKAENINAALGLVTGEVTLLLDADHHPARDAAVRALRWFDAGYDVVQGRCVIRDYRRNWLSRIVAVEFEQMYAVAHAGRSILFDTAMFGGTNGWWRTSALREIRMHDQMLTEDIDSSVRALLAGYRVIHDRSVISTELAPPTAKAWWSQRTRWAQGWFQVTVKHQRAVLRSRYLSGELKAYWTYLLAWREVFPVLSLQIFALLLADALLDKRFVWFANPLLVVTSVLTLIVGPLVGLITYRVALERLKRDLGVSFFLCAVFSLVYTTVKNTVAMVAAVRELVGQRSWVVTSRIAGPAAAVLVVAGLAMGTAPRAQGATRQPSRQQTATLKLAPLASAMTLVGRAPVATANVPLPSDWTTLRGTLTLHWQASPSVTANSSLRILIGGTVVAAPTVKAGLGSVNVPIARQRVSGDQLQIEIDGQLHTRIDTRFGIPDAATSALVVLSSSTSKLTLTGTRAAGTPLLEYLPGSLADVLGTTSAPLYIGLPARPSDDEVRAAALIAGAVTRASGNATVPIRVMPGASSRSLEDVGGQAVEIIPSGRPTIAARRRPDGRLLLTLTGAGNGVIRAAAALASPDPQFFAGSRATITTGTSPGTPPKPSATASITPAAARGTNALDLQASFRLPESRQLTHGDAHIVLDLAYNAPAGGRIATKINGYPVMTRNLPAQGQGELTYRANLVENPVDVIDNGQTLGDVGTGMNFITITGSLPPGQPVGGAGDAIAPELDVLSSSHLHYTSQPRTGLATLAVWPWPYANDEMTKTTFVLPASPTASELGWALGTIAAVSQWESAPESPQIAIGPPALPSGNVVVLARGLNTPVPLPTGAPVEPTSGLLETYESGQRHLLVAYTPQALRPLAAGYYVDKVKGLAAVVSDSGTATTVVKAPTPSAFTTPALDWEGPAAIFAFVALSVFFWRMYRTRRRLDDLPPVPPATASLDEAAVRAQIEQWEALVAHEGANGASSASADTATDPPASAT